MWKDIAKACNAVESLWNSEIELVTRKRFEDEATLSLCNENKWYGSALQRIY